MLKFKIKGAWYRNKSPQGYFSSKRSIKEKLSSLELKCISLLYLTIEESKFCFLEIKGWKSKCHCKIIWTRPNYFGPVLNFGPDAKTTFHYSFLLFDPWPKRFGPAQTLLDQAKISHIVCIITFMYACKDCLDAQWENECNNAGDCRDGSCFCDIGFEGYKCQVERTSYYSAPHSS